MHSYSMQFEGDSRFGPEISFEALSHDFSAVCTILGDPGAVSRVNKMFTVRSRRLPGHLGPVQTSNFSCAELNTYLGRSK